MIRRILGITAIAAVAALALDAPTQAEKSESDIATMFRSRCANCHAVPDIKLATDRAWLDQVNRTA